MTYEQHVVRGRREHLFASSIGSIVHILRISFISTYKSVFHSYILYLDLISNRMKKKHIAILTGGPSSEREISINSANLVAKHLDQSKYSFRLIDVKEDGWSLMANGEKIDLNEFSLTIDGTKEYFDFAFLMIHGTPAEDGKMQGYFEMMKIPHSTCLTLSSALTFDKQMCKDFLTRYDIPLAPSIKLHSAADLPLDEIKRLGYPLFVKPNAGGSSFGVSKVGSREELMPALEHAFLFDHEVVVEGYLEGREFGCGVVRDNGQTVAFPITELIPHDEFFTYEAKYQGRSDEITPANLSPELTTKCKELSRRMYDLLKCRGVVRFDYILVDDTFYMLEVNTIPGMSEASIVPQQAVAHGWTISHLLEVIILDCDQLL